MDRGYAMARAPSSSLFVLKMLERLMAWCVGNAKVELKGSAVTITKKVASTTAKIDPLMVLFDAVALTDGCPPVPDVQSAYELRDLLVVEEPA